MSYIKPADKFKESKIKIVITIIVVLLALGFIADAFNGFIIIRSYNLLFIIIGLIVLGLLSFIIEASGEWLFEKISNKKNSIFNRIIFFLLTLSVICVSIYFVWIKRI